MFMHRYVTTIFIFVAGYFGSLFAMEKKRPIIAASDSTIIFSPAGIFGDQHTEIDIETLHEGSAAVASYLQAITAPLSTVSANVQFAEEAIPARLADRILEEFFKKYTPKKCISLGKMLLTTLYHEATFMKRLCTVGYLSQRELFIEQEAKKRFRASLYAKGKEFYCIPLVSTKKGLSDHEFLQELITKDYFQSISMKAIKNPSYCKVLYKELIALDKEAAQATGALQTSRNATSQWLRALLASHFYGNLKTDLYKLFDQQILFLCLLDCCSMSNSCRFFLTNSQQQIPYETLCSAEEIQEALEAKSFFDINPSIHPLKFFSEANGVQQICSEIAQRNLFTNQSARHEDLSDEDRQFIAENLAILANKWRTTEGAKFNYVYKKIYQRVLEAIQKVEKNATKAEQLKKRTLGFCPSLIRKKVAAMIPGGPCIDDGFFMNPQLPEDLRDCVIFDLPSFEQEVEKFRVASEKEANDKQQEDSWIEPALQKQPARTSKVTPKKTSPPKNRRKKKVVMRETATTLADESALSTPATVEKSAEKPLVPVVPAPKKALLTINLSVKKTDQALSAPVVTGLCNSFGSPVEKIIQDTRFIKIFTTDGIEWGIHKPILQEMPFHDRPYHTFNYHSRVEKWFTNPQEALANAMNETWVPKKQEPFVLRIHTFPCEIDQYLDYAVEASPQVMQEIAFENKGLILQKNLILSGYVCEPKQPILFCYFVWNFCPPQKGMGWVCNHRCIQKRVRDADVQQYGAQAVYDKNFPELPKKP